ncbi:MAG: ATP-binding protein [Deltaproteobacteria bacterium]|nr:ATP-binding protein [Deltaproteobacteria bacterium]
MTAGTAESYTETTIISGKGGSGKTTVVASLAMLADGIVLADNDVDAADLHLLIPPTVGQAHDFVGGLQMRIDEAKCTACGECAEACHFSAIRCRDEEGETRYQIDELACEGCGLCGHVCEFDAIISQPKKTGRWYLSSTPRGPMAHARLGIAEENSGRLVTQVRQAAAGLARKLMLGRILGDGPPGTGCPVIASVSGADRVLIVTEPTVSGVHDMERVLRLAAHFRIPAGIVINKADLNQEQAERIESIAREMGARILARIPFDRNVNEALMAGRTLIEHGKGPAREALIGLWNELKRNDHGENETKESQS